MAAAARRFGIVVGSIVGGTAAVSLLLGLAFGSSVSRALSLGWYIVGSVLLISGFFVGNRGPARVKSESDTRSSPMGMLLGGGRNLRWATLGEQNETINNSAVFITVGLVLVAIGILFDSRHAFF